MSLTTAFIDTTVQTIETVIKTEHLQKFQESLIRDYPALVYSVLWAHSPLCRLRNSVVYWCSHHWHQSWTQYSTDSLLHYTKHYAVLQLLSPFSLLSTLIALLYTEHCLAMTHMYSSDWMLVLYATYVFLKYSVLSQSVFWKRLALCLFRRHWHTSSLDGRGFVGHHTSR